MTNDTYNGWSNYATWRINLEIFSGKDSGDWEGQKYDSIMELAHALEEEAEEVVSGFGDIPTDSLAYSYALSFLSQVNYYEIAEHIAEDNSEIIKATHE